MIYHQFLNNPLIVISMTTGFILMLLGLWGILTKKNIIRIILSFTLIDTGLHVVMVAIGHLKGRTAPIIDSVELKNNALSSLVDPIPSALVLTAIVIGLGVTALLLTYAIQIHHKGNSLVIDNYEGLKW